MRAARRTLRCFVDWGVLQEATEKGVYEGTPPRCVQNTTLAAWLIEAVLTASGVQADTLSGITQGPVLFPFAVEFPSTTIVESRNRLEVFRQGFNETMVTLRRYEEVR